LRKPFSPSLIGFVLIIFNLKRFTITGERVKSYVRRADIVSREGRLKRLVYKDSIMVDKCREVENTLGASCNEEMTKKKSVKKEVRCEQM